MKHTKPPYAVDGSRLYPLILTDDKKNLVAKIYGDDGKSADATAAYIVQCVNAHDDLVKALEKSIDGFTYGGSKQGIHNSSETAEFIRSVYLKAKGANHD